MKNRATQDELDRQLHSMGYAFTYPDCVFIKLPNGKEIFNIDQAIGFLILKGIITFFQNSDEENKDCSFGVICSDVFVHAYDLEPIQNDEIEKLARMVIADDVWGATKWCILKRKEYPHKDMLENMISLGVWDFSVDDTSTFNFYPST